MQLLVLRFNSDFRIHPGATRIHTGMLASRSGPRMGKNRFYHIRFITDRWRRMNLECGRICCLVTLIVSKKFGIFCAL